MRKPFMKVLMRLAMARKFLREEKEYGQWFYLEKKIDKIGERKGIGNGRKVFIREGRILRIGMLFYVEGKSGGMVVRDGRGIGGNICAICFTLAI
jgi:hypothetical protein